MMAPVPDRAPGRRECRWWRSVRASESFTRECYHSLNIATCCAPDSRLHRDRVDARCRSFRLSCLAAPELSARRGDLLLHTWPGRLFLVAAALKLVVAVVRRLAGVPGAIEVVSSAATHRARSSRSAYFVWRLFLLMKRRLLWRVRRKLILSYIFIGVVPALLIIAFFLLGAWVVSINVSAYLFQRRLRRHRQLRAPRGQAAAAEIARTPATRRARRWRGCTGSTRAGRYRRVLDRLRSDRATTAPPPVRAGEWSHARRRRDSIAGLADGEGDGGFIGHDRAARRIRTRRDVELIVRAAVPVGRARAACGYVIVDIPVDGEIIDELLRGDRRQGRRGAASAATRARRLPPVTDRDRRRREQARRSSDAGVTILDAYELGHAASVHRATIAITYALRRALRQALERAVGQMRRRRCRSASAILFILVVVAVLFLIIEFVALVMGLALARSITSSIHELFMGTERVRHGDFTHRIDIMTERSARRAGRLVQPDDRQHREPAADGGREEAARGRAAHRAADPDVAAAARAARRARASPSRRCASRRGKSAGTTTTSSTCPASQLGVLIADVSGKGTSAALYMAELKGLVLSLSQIYQSPRQLLIEVNRIISENLDSRSFITMTYAVHRPRRRHDDLRARRAHAAHLSCAATRRRRGRAGADAERHGARPAHPGRDGEVQSSCSKRSRIDLGNGRRHRALHRRHHRGDEHRRSDLFGDARLSRIVEEHGHLDSGELRERILREIEAFVGAADQHDDMTMILLESRARGARLPGESEAAGDRRPRQ